MGGLPYLVFRRDRLAIEDKGMNGLYIGELITTALSVESFQRAREMGKTLMDNYEIVI